MKAKLTAPATKSTTPKAEPSAMEKNAAHLLDVILNTPDLLDKLLTHPAVTARMEKILEAYEFEVNVDEDVEKVLTPRLKAITDTATRLHERVTSLEKGPQRLDPLAKGGR